MTEKKTSSKASAVREKAEKPTTAAAAAKETAAEKTAAKKTTAKKTTAAAAKTTASTKKTTAAAKETAASSKKTAAKETSTAAKKTSSSSKKTSTASKKSSTGPRKMTRANKKSTASAKKTSAAKKSTAAAEKTPAAEKQAAAPEKTAPKAEAETKAVQKAAAEAAPEKAPAAKKVEKVEPEKKISVLFATPECVPFASSGGLGEVSGSLPASLNRSGSIDCRVIMPLYASIHRDYRNEMKYIGYKYVDVTWRHQYMGLFKLEMNGVTYYFIDNEYYFKREGLYGYYDDCERFTFFSKAVYKAMELMDDFHPDIIHANDWQAALIPIYQNSYFRLPYLKTVFTVHNIEYQGHYGKEVESSVLGLNENDNYIVEYGGDVNLMKGAIESANAFTTVSPSYAEELKMPEFAFGLDSIVRRNDHKLTGILNGIDTDSYDPSKDRAIAKNYSASDISGKAECKRDLQRMAGLEEKDVPVITMISRLVPAKGMDLIINALDAILYENDVQFVMLGTGYKQYEDFFRGLAYRHPDKAACFIEFDAAKSRKCYAGGDIFIMPSKSEPCGISQMIAARYGNIPVVREVGGLRDSIKDCTLGEGSGFTFRDFDPNAFKSAVMNAVGRYYDRENWRKLIEYDMQLDFSWNASAEKYVKLYKSML